MSSLTPEMLQWTKSFLAGTAAEKILQTLEANQSAQHPVGRSAPGGSATAGGPASPASAAHGTSGPPPSAPRGSAAAPPSTSGPGASAVGTASGTMPSVFNYSDSTSAMLDQVDAAMHGIYYDPNDDRPVQVGNAMIQLKTFRAGLDHALQNALKALLARKGTLASDIQAASPKSLSKVADDAAHKSLADAANYFNQANAGFGTAPPHYADTYMYLCLSAWYMSQTSTNLAAMQKSYIDAQDAYVHILEDVREGAGAALRVAGSKLGPLGSGVAALIDDLTEAYVDHAEGKDVNWTAITADVVLSAIMSGNVGKNLSKALEKPVGEFVEKNLGETLMSDKGLVRWFREAYFPAEQKQALVDFEKALTDGQLTPELDKYLAAWATQHHITDILVEMLIDKWQTALLLPAKTIWAAVTNQPHKTVRQKIDDFIQAFEDGSWLRDTSVSKIVEKFLHESIKLAK